MIKGDVGQIGQQSKIEIVGADGRACGKNIECLANCFGPAVEELGCRVRLFQRFPAQSLKVFPKSCGETWVIGVPLLLTDWSCCCRLKLCGKKETSGTSTIPEKEYDISSNTSDDEIYTNFRV